MPGALEHMAAIAAQVQAEQERHLERAALAAGLPLSATAFLTGRSYGAGREG